MIPLHNNVFIKRDLPPTITDAGIQIAPGSLPPCNTGTIVHIGPDCVPSFKERASPGSRIYFPSFAGTPFKNGDDEFIMLKDTEIVAVI